VTRKNEKLELESAACEFEKGIAGYEALLKEKEGDLEDAQDDMEKRRARWAYHQNNMTFMKNNDVVDLGEFEKVTELLATSWEKYDEAAGKVRQIYQAIKDYKGVIVQAGEELVKIKKALGEYGKILKFPND